MLQQVDFSGIIDTSAETPALNDYLVFNGTSFNSCTYKYNIYIYCSRL